MTERLYYTDSTLTEFVATVVDCSLVADRPHVVLDRTAFYPTSGGQPFDTGRLGDAQVVDVIDRDDHVVEHVLSAPLAIGQSVRGVIDWPRRLDHMQQHTGQHVLSAAFDRELNARTMSFHLGSETSTIDLDREVSPKEIARVEEIANAVVWEDRPVTVRFVSDEEIAGLGLRKEPARKGRLRIVDVDRFDVSACGGTHVSRTGTIGIIAISAWERFKGGGRITFVCGGRALRSYAALRDVVTDGTRMLSVSADELGTAIGRLQQDVKASGRLVRDLQQEVADQRAIDRRSQSETIGAGRAVLRHEPGWDAAAVKTLASAIVREPGFVAALVGEGQPVPVVIARSADRTLDASALMKAATERFGGRGGGRAELAQGGIPAAPQDILAFVRERLNAFQ